VALVLALDVGGTKLAAAVVDQAGRIRGRSRVPSPTGSDPEALYEALIACAAAALRGADTTPDELVGIGVASAGPMIWPSGEVSPLNMPAWRGFPLRKRLAEEFDAQRVLIHNDAVGLAVGEHWKGAGTGTGNLLGITVSTGVGGGLILGGRLHHGKSGNAGHVGHVVVDPEGPDCACGGRGCLEAVARGPAPAAWAVERGWRPTGEGTARAMAADARRGDPAASAAFDRGGVALGVAIASVVASLDLSVVVVGGGLAGAWDLLEPAVSATYHRHAGLAFARSVPVVPTALGPDAGLVGAAALVLSGDVYWHGSG
jgi:glucokinase